MRSIYWLPTAGVSARTPNLAKLVAGALQQAKAAQELYGLEVGHTRIRQPANAGRTRRQEWGSATIHSHGQHISTPTVEAEIERLTAIAKLLRNSEGPRSRREARRTLSKKTRGRIAAAQKARWAKARAGKTKA